MRAHAVITASLFACCIGSATAANLIVNGGFEQPAQASGAYTLVPTGSGFEGWTVIGARGNVAPISGAYASGGVTFPAHGGGQWLDLTGLSNTPTGVQQSVQTVSGTQYDLSFFVGNVVGGGWGTSSSVEVLVDGQSLGVATNSGGAGLNRQVWERFHFTFTASGPSTTLAFMNRDPRNDNTNGLDDVVLVTHAEALAACQGAPGEAKGARRLFGKLSALAGGALVAAKRAGGADGGQQVLTAIQQTTAEAGDGSDECEGQTRPAPAGAPGSPGVAAAGTLDPGSRVESAADAYEGLVTSDAPSPQPVRGPEKAPPDIGGIRLGMSPEEAHAALLKRYPGRKINVTKYDIYTPNSRTPVTAVLESFSIGLNELVTPEDRIRILFTPPPGKPVVWGVTRNLFKQNIYRANALTSLREKYGRESLARTEEGTTDDSKVKSMNWIFDRQGHLGATPPGGGVQTLEACLQRANGQSMFTYDRILQPGHSEAQMASDLAISPWCSSSGIIVWAEIPPGPIIGTLTVQAIDNPTVESAMRAEGEWLHKLTAARAQQAIDASKQSKPDL